jgi:hypothetical protein
VKPLIGKISNYKKLVARSKEISEKCRRCAPLSPVEARAKHPQCWDDKLCTARRFYINNRDRINQKRARKRIDKVHQIPVPQVNYGILQVWREMREDSPIHAIGIEIWAGNSKLAVVSPVHCAGWLPSQVHEYLRQALTVLDTQYGLKKFASEVLINPAQCPIRPCFLCQ